jgi:hypothetical protein
MNTGGPNQVVKRRNKQQMMKLVLISMTAILLLADLQSFLCWPTRAEPLKQRGSLALSGYVTFRFALGSGKSFSGAILLFRNFRSIIVGSGIFVAIFGPTNWSGLCYLCKG